MTTFVPDYQALFQASPYPYLLIGTDFTIVAANAAYIAAVGVASEELVGRHLFDAFPRNPADPGSTNDDAVKQNIETAIATGKPQTTAFLRYAVPRATAAGTTFENRYWSTINTPVLDANGDVTLVAHSAIDVTRLYDFNDASVTSKVHDEPLSDATAIQQAQTHQALIRILKSERNHLLGLFNQAPGFIAVLRGPDHVFELVNEAYYQLVGHRVIVGKPVREALPDIMGQGFEQLLDQVYTSGAPFVGKGMRFVAQRKEGGPVAELFIDLLYQPVFEADGTVSGIFAQGQDVTEIYQANRALRAADRRKDEFLAMLAHELRNPLAPIRTAAELIPLIATQPPKVDAVGRTIGRHVEQMSGLLDDLLDVSRVTSGLVVLKRERVVLQDVVADAVEQLAANFAARSQQLTRDLPSAPVVVAGDHKRLVQVVANLLGNAAKYSAEYSSVMLSIAREDDVIAISVSDAGIGIDPEFLPHVFDLFAQSKRSSARSEGGLGLGLSLVKNLVELHEGTVEAYSSGANRGSRFTVKLPALDVEPVRSQSGDAAPPPAQDGIFGLRVMVVDDNVEAAELMADYLGLFGALVTVAHDAGSALAAAENAHFDIYLLDIGLPGPMDGNGLARALRSRDASARATLVAVTGYGQLADRAAGSDAGFDEYLVKPVDMDRVMRVCADTVGKIAR
jgi:PAS domain S-box-containing protein